jgi:hypothetical protein
LILRTVLPAVNSLELQDLAMKAKDNVFRFRSVKWGDPQQKLKMLPDDSGKSHWRILAVILAFAVGCAGGIFLF